MVKEIVVGNGKRGLPEDILYLTDDPGLLAELRQKGKKAAAVLTEENRSRDFSGIPYAVERIEELEEDDFERLYRRLAGLPWDILETERCRLREMTVQDVDRLYEIYAEPCIAESMEKLFEDRDAERKYAEDYRRYVYEFYGYGIWVIEEKASGVLIGRAGIEPKEKEPELGYLIAGPWQRQGYGFEVCSAVLAYARREIGCGSIVSRVRPDNRASASLLEKLGFRDTKETGKDGMKRYRIVF